MLARNLMNWTMTIKVLVTGAAGFLGKALCTELVARGVRVTAMVRHVDAKLPDGVQRWVAPSLPQLSPDTDVQLSNIDVVIHAAGRAHVIHDQSTDPLAAFRYNNTDGTLARREEKPVKYLRPRRALSLTP